MLGVCLGKIVLSSTSEKILCLCPTDHSLASLLGGMHDAGITSMVLVGNCGKIAKLDPYQMEHRPACNSSKSQTRQLMQLEKALDAFQSKIALLQRTSHLNRKPEITEVVKWLRRHNPEAFEELRGAITDESGETVDDTKVSKEQRRWVHVIVVRAMKALYGLPHKAFSPAGEPRECDRTEMSRGASFWTGSLCRTCYVQVPTANHRHEFLGVLCVCSMVVFACLEAYLFHEDFHRFFPLIQV